MYYICIFIYILQFIVYLLLFFFFAVLPEIDEDELIEDFGEISISRQHGIHDEC